MINRKVILDLNNVIDELISFLKENDSIHYRIKELFTAVLTSILEGEIPVDNDLELLVIHKQLAKENFASVYPKFNKIYRELGRLTTIMIENPNISLGMERKRIQSVLNRIKTFEVHQQEDDFQNSDDGNK